MMMNLATYHCWMDGDSLHIYRSGLPDGSPGPGCNGTKPGGTVARTGASVDLATAPRRVLKGESDGSG